MLWKLSNDGNSEDTQTSMFLEVGGEEKCRWKSLQILLDWFCSSPWSG